MILTVANPKGGVGKTAAAVALAAGAARSGVRTLLVDADPAGQATLALGERKKPGLYRLLAEGESCARVVRPARENLFLIPGDEYSARASRLLLYQPFHEGLLAAALSGTDYSLVVIDTPPSASEVLLPALVAADFVLIPTLLEPLAIDGVVSLLFIMQRAAQQGKAPEYALLPMQFENGSRLHADQLDRLTQKFGKRVWPPVPRDAHAREAPGCGQTVWEYSPGSAAVKGLCLEGRWAGGYQEALAILMERMHENAKP